jgi:hypothetical protein
VMRLVAADHNDSEISRLTGIPAPRSGNGDSARTKSHLTDRDASSRDSPATGSATLSRRASWPRVRPPLGLYLGDGTISRQPRGVTVFASSWMPSIRGSSRDASARCLRSRFERIGMLDHPGCVEIGSSWKHWPCVFPQAGPGMKHTRPIVLTGWQQRIVESHPEDFLRGLFESDGNAGTSTCERRTRLRDGSRNTGTAATCSATSRRISDGCSPTHVRRWVSTGLRRIGETSRFRVAMTWPRSTNFSAPNNDLVSPSRRSGEIGKLSMDSKSIAFTGLWVRVPPAAQSTNRERGR